MMMEMLLGNDKNVNQVICCISPVVVTLSLSGAFMVLVPNKMLQCFKQHVTKKHNDMGEKQHIMCMVPVNAEELSFAFKFQCLSKSDSKTVDIILFGMPKS